MPTGTGCCSAPALRVRRVPPGSGVATIDEALALRAGGDTGDVLCWLASPGADFASAIAAGIEVTASSAEQLAEILAAGGPSARCSSRSTPGCPATARTASSGRRSSPRPRALRPLVRSRSPVSGRTSPAPTSRRTRPTTSRSGCSSRRRRARRCRCHARAASPQQLGRDPDPTVGAPRPRPGRHRVVRHQPRPQPRPRRRPAAGDDAAGASSPRSSASPPARASRTVTPGPPSARRPSGSCRSATPRASCAPRPTAGRSRTATSVRPSPARSAWTSSSSTSATHDAQRGDVVTLFGPDGPSADDWAIAAGTIAYEVVTRLGGRIERTYRGER